MEKIIITIILVNIEITIIQTINFEFEKHDAFIYWELKNFPLKIVFVVYTLYALECVDPSRLTGPHSKWMIGSSDTSQIHSDIFLSYNNGVFTL